MGDSSCLPRNSYPSYFVTTLHGNQRLKSPMNAEEGALNREQKRNKLEYAEYNTKEIRKFVQRDVVIQQERTFSIIYNGSLQGEYSNKALHVYHEGPLGYDANICFIYRRLQGFRSVNRPLPRSWALTRSPVEIGV